MNRLADDWANTPMGRQASKAYIDALRGRRQAFEQFAKNLMGFWLKWYTLYTFMKVSISFIAYVVDSEASREASPHDVPTSFLVQDAKLADYLDADVADRGVVGGSIRIVVDHTSHVDVDYWCPALPSEDLIGALLKYTTAQLGDGIGEGGFEYTSDAGRWLVVADTDKPAEVIVSDDGQVIAGPPRIAIAARDGDLSSLRASLAAAPEEMRRQHQGYPALHLAILFGHPDAVAALLAAGADPNQLDSQSQAPLELCALSNSLSDEESRQIALLLLEAGADRDRQSQDGETAKYYAESRGKLLLVSVL